MPGPEYSTHCPAYQEMMRGLRLLQEHLDRGGLSDAGLSRHEDETAPAIERPGQLVVQTLQHLVSPHDEARLAARCDGECADTVAMNRYPPSILATNRGARGSS